MRLFHGARWPMLRRVLPCIAQDLRPASQGSTISRHGIGGEVRRMREGFCCIGTCAARCTAAALMLGTQMIGLSTALSQWLLYSPMVNLPPLAMASLGRRTTSESLRFARQCVHRNDNSWTSIRMWPAWQSPARRWSFQRPTIHIMSLLCGECSFVPSAEPYPRRNVLSLGAPCPGTALGTRKTTLSKLSRGELPHGVLRWPAGE